MARLAFALVKLRDQVNEAAPKRSKKADGWIGDSEHSKRKSDHNPNKAGVVQALDITHDPKNGLDSYALAEILRASKDSRIKYVISNGRIFSSTEKPWQWRKYSGSNSHSAHVHVSVKDDPRKYDDQSAWNIGLKPAARPAPKPSEPPAHVKPVAAVPAAEPEKKSGISEGAVVGGGLSVAGVGATVWEKLTEAPESLLTALIAVASKPTFWVIVGAGVACAYIFYRRRQMKRAA